MAASPVLNHPWPEPTVSIPSPTPVERHASTSKLISRQIVADQAAIAAAKTQCEIDSGNEVISCFPTADVVVPQHEWTSFVWNSNDPDFVQSERVDVYLFHGDSLEMAFLLPNQINLKQQAGFVNAQVNDSWWGDRGANWAGKNISYPFYWLIARAGESLTDGTLKPQTTFSAVQTTFADSILSSMASSSASAARLTSTRLSSSTVTSISGGIQTTTVPAGSLQPGSNSSAFPTWAIVLIVIGIVAVVAICGGLLFIVLYIRGDRRNDRSPLPSDSPSMAQAVVTPVPVVGAAGLVRDTSVASHAQRTISPAQRTTSPDSTTSRTDARPFSASDAEIMAGAFRSALRQPGRPLEEEETSGSPEQEALLRRELGDEGTDLRSVESARGVRVESSSEDHGYPRHL
ncbi:hypothetical protein C8R44DRAFT_878253 [Mycena epipterygia]|nr:hypothetical protein C8R44DRAFT_878253 [Mycena epipterygia]